MCSTFFLLFLLVGGTSSDVMHNEADEQEKWLQENQAPLKYLLVFGSLMISLCVRHLFHHYDVPIPYAVVTIVCGFLWGLGSLSSTSMRRITVMTIEMLENFEYVYVPAMIFTISFCVDVHSFFRSLSQIIVISGPVACTSAVITGLAVRLVINDNWSRVDAVIFGSMFICSYPMDVMHHLKETSVQNKHVQILMDGETLMTTSWSFTMYAFLVAYSMGYMVHWYQFVMQLIRKLLLGILLGYICGRIGASLMKTAYNDPLGIILITLSVAFTSYYYITWIANGGIIGMLVVGVVMGSKRPSLSQEINHTITTFWKLVTYLLSDVLFLYVGIVFTKILEHELYFQDYAMVMVTYLLTNISRFMGFLLFSPILSRLGYGMSFQNMVFCVWVGLKNPICVNLALHLRNTAYHDNHQKATIFLLHAILVYITMLFINGSLVKRLKNALSMSELSISRQINMNNCMKFIYEARARTVAILKMDRFVSDANWPLVMDTTNMKHPYKSKNQDLVQLNKEEGEENFLGYKYTYCPDCQTNIPNEPTGKEMREMTKEAKLRILKLKKTTYSRLFENGMVSTGGIRSLHQAVDVAMDTEELVIELDGLFKLFEKEGFFYRFLENMLKLIVKNPYDKLMPPRLRWRLFFYRIIKRDTLFIIMNLVAFGHLLTLTYVIAAESSFIDTDEHKRITTPLYALTSVVFFFLYVGEFFIKIFAFSWIYIWKHGVVMYFRTYTNMLDFLILITCFFTYCFHYFRFLFECRNCPTGLYFDCVLEVLLLIRSLRVVYFLKYIPIFREMTPRMMKYLESQIDRHRAMAFEIAKNYIAAEEEILQNLHQIIDQDQIRELIKKKIQEDRLAVTKRLGIAQKESPHVAQTVKTKQAMRTVLSAMKQDVFELKASGWVDEAEYRSLIKSITVREAFIHSIKRIEPSSSKLIFREIGYMGNDNELVEFLYANVTTRKFTSGESVLEMGTMVTNITILISGMLKVSFTPHTLIIRDLADYGICPVVEYLDSTSYKEPMCDYLLPGTTVGEKGLLTERPYDGVVTAETTCVVYVLNKAVITKAIEMKDDPVTGFECLLWKHLSLGQALLIMMNTSAYRTYPLEKIRYLLESSFSPKLSNFKYLTVNSMIADIILIQGIVIDINTKELYTAPSYIPRAVQKLIFPHSGLVEVDSLVETRLLIIPAKDYNEYEIMLSQEETCELIEKNSPNCVGNYIQRKGLLHSSIPKVAKSMERVMSKFKKRQKSASSAQSQITDVHSPFE